MKPHTTLGSSGRVVGDGMWKCYHLWISAPGRPAAIFGGGEPFVGKPSTYEAIDGPGLKEPAIPAA
jgi:hypothetical protein